MCLISLIIPIYNVQDYIGRCLDSIFLQRYNNVQLECILVNDCSQDNSMYIVHKKLNDYSGDIKFITIDHQKNWGLCVARNTGLDNASGDYVLFVDSDDRLKPDAISSFLNAIEAVNGDVDVVVGNSYVSKNDKLAMEFANDSSFILDNKNEEALHCLLKREIFHTAWNKLVKRNFLHKYKIYFEKGIIDEDLLWSYYVFLYSSRVLVMPKVTYVYEDNPGSIMNTASRKISLIVHSRIIICRQILDTPPKYIVPEYYTYIFYIFIRAINLYELYAESIGNSWEKELVLIRNRLLKSVLKDKYLFLILFFLISYKPFYYITKYGWFRRYYDGIVKIVLKLSR